MKNPLRNSYPALPVPFAKSGSGKIEPTPAVSQLVYT